MKASNNGIEVACTAGFIGFLLGCAAAVTLSASDKPQNQAQAYLVQTEPTASRKEELPSLQKYEQSLHKDLSRVEKAVRRLKFETNLKRDTSMADLSIRLSY